MEEPFYAQDEFPENMSSTDGMKIIYGKDETGITCLPDEVYAEKTELPKLNGCIDFYGSVNILTMNDAPTAFDHNAPHSASNQYLEFCPPENPEECSRRMPYIIFMKIRSCRRF